MAHKEVCTNRQVVFQGHILTVNHDQVMLEDGSVTKREVVHHHGGVAIAALEGNDIYLVSQYRYAYDAQLLELPAGKLEQGEDPKACAVRELEEEVGLLAKKIVFLGEVYPTVGYCDEVIYLYQAVEFEQCKQKLDEGEFLDLVKISFDEALEMVLNGTIKDSKTQIAILKIAALKGK